MVTGGAGFLLAVLWFDLMFDVQVWGHHDAELPGEVLVSIAAYYRRVTTDARPMNRLVVVAMLTTIGGAIGELVDHVGPAWGAWASLVLATSPVLVAGIRTVPSAVRLGGRSDDTRGQSALARSILRDHCLCLVAVAAVLIVQAVSAV